MQYVALLSKEGRNTLIEFPDAPGCQTFAAPGDKVLDVATEALEGWLEAHLVRSSHTLPLAPRKHNSARGRSHLVVTVRPMLAAKIELRRLRMLRELTQRELGERLGVSQQAVAKLEDPDQNTTLESLRKAANALDGDVAITIAARV